MLPKKELQYLAKALKETPEYVQMLQYRRTIMKNPRLAKLMLSFERENMKVMHHDFPEDQVSAQIKKIYHEYKEFLEQEVVRGYTQAAQSYQKMVSSCIEYLNGLLDTSQTAKPY